MKPIPLPANQPSRFYRGGAAIARFRGVPSSDPYVPEDWVGSTTTLLGENRLGLTLLADGRPLREAIAAEPELFLGPEHLRRFGPEPRVLVKLLDAGERLPVHAHPDGAFASRELGAANGKSEAWLIIGAEGDRPLLNLGFREDMDSERLAAWIASQDVESMLAALNEVPVAYGDCVYVPAGTPHSIGEGILMVEVQEPSDLGVMLEWSTFGIAAEEASMGLGFEVALDGVRQSAVGLDELASWRRQSVDAPLVRPGARTVVPPEAERFFRAEWLKPDPVVSMEPSFAILVAVSGSGRLETEDGALDLARGETVLVPHAAGAAELTGEVELIRCLAPRPEEASPR
ncbi:MAG: class I mannose-6-phosphate isomerase [Gaiellaceae bacterium]